MEPCKTVKTWEKTRLSNLVRHKSGRYYARAYAKGEEVWKSLKTSHFSVAELKLADFLRDHRKRRDRLVDAASLRMKFSDAAAIHRKRLDEDVSIKPRTRDYWNEVLAALKKSWPSLGETEVRRVTEDDCSAWAARYSKAAGATRYNNTIAVLRHVLEVAVQAGVISFNPAGKLKRRRPKDTVLTLPTREQFARFIREMESAGSRDSRNCADLAQGLAFTGCRIGEARELERRDIDFVAGVVVVKGDAETATKNGQIRRVPMIGEARELFERMLSPRQDESPLSKVFLVRECQKSMNRAARRVGMDRITHHDLRHFFATICLESGVDIPLVSRWLGHKDGGALVLKVYGHLRDEHSTASARKVNFKAAESENNVVPFERAQVHAEA